LIKLEKLLTFSGQKRWIFLPKLGSPGKVWHDRTLEAVGSTPIGYTNLSRGSTTFDALKPSQDFPLSEFLFECF